MPAVFAGAGSLLNVIPQTAPQPATINRAMKRNRDFHGAPPPWQTAKPKTVVEEQKDLL